MIWRPAGLAMALALLPAALAAEPAETGYAEANGLNMYYELHGEGDGPPLLVLHGAYMSTGLMAPVIDRFAADRRVVAMDLQGHGRTTDIDRPIGYEAMADDVAALMAALDIGTADVFGYSMGASTAFQLAIRHPERVRRLVAASGTYRTDGMYPELVAMIGEMTAESFASTPFEATYREVAPNPDDFPRLVEKLVALDSATPQEWPEEAIAGIAAPTLVISGDADAVRPEHSVEIFRLLGGGPSVDFMQPGTAELAILPGTTHLGLIEDADVVVSIVTRFLDKAVD